MSQKQEFAVRTISSGFGAIIEGVDLSVGLAEPDFVRIRDAFHRHGVIFFQDQDLTPQQHLDFATRWGEINVNRFFQSVEGHPQIAEVRKEPDQKINIGGGWHTDHSYDEIPALGSMLYAREVPQSGGDTMFADMARAWEGLSAGLRRTLSGMRAIHSGRHVFGTQAITQEKSNKDDISGRIGNPEAVPQDVTHPVMIHHPDTGREILYVNPGFTIGFEGWEPGESAALLRYLFKQARRPENTIRYQWARGSIALWDNRATWHYALNDYHGERRLMHRITIEGVPLS